MPKLTLQKLAERRARAILKENPIRFITAIKVYRDTMSSEKGMVMGLREAHDAVVKIREEMNKKNG